LNSIFNFKYYNIADILSVKILSLGLIILKGYYLLNNIILLYNGNYQNQMLDDVLLCIKEGEDKKKDDKNLFKYQSLIFKEKSSGKKKGLLEKSSKKKLQMFVTYLYRGVKLSKSCVGNKLTVNYKMDKLQRK